MAEWAQLIRALVGDHYGGRTRWPDQIHHGGATVHGGHPRACSGSARTTRGMHQSRIVICRVDALERAPPLRLTPLQLAQRVGMLRPSGHGDEGFSQSAVPQENRTLRHTLVKGEHSKPHLDSIDEFSDDNDGPVNFPMTDTRGTQHNQSVTYSLRSVGLPWIWWRQSEVMKNSMWELLGLILRPCISLEMLPYSIDSCPKLCVAIFAKFNKNKYVTIFAFKQSDSVSW